MICFVVVVVVIRLICENRHLEQKKIATTKRELIISRIKRNLLSNLTLWCNEQTVIIKKEKQRDKKLF